ncbi:MAG TPA: dTDP-4-dehydrorhamnose 3,5-epimerase family protein [Bacteroidota bacterium]|jgi:dTDP-4-dehydrorhamnose 3,5-epimerase
MFKRGKIDGIVVKSLEKFIDKRGWLLETFRLDELQETDSPAMGYVSVTNAGVARGPHEHVDQSDNFSFIGPSNFKIYLWDNRKSSPTFKMKQVLIAGEEAPHSIIIPPGVVHAYKNVGSVDGMVLNFPNRLYAGKGKKEPVDEVRHEDDPKTPYILD